MSIHSSRFAAALAREAPRTAALTILRWTLLVSFALGCGSKSLAYRPIPEVAPAEQPRSVAGVVAPPTRAPENVTWLPWSKSSFDRAKAENKYVLLLGSASWCHWCHVMDATTFSDVEVVRLVSERFVPVRVDMDARPDLEERYGGQGWPVLVVLSPEGEEIARYYGYLLNSELVALLERTLEVGPESTDPKGGAPGRSPRVLLEPGALSAPVSALPWVQGRTLLDLESYYDPVAGGWGIEQKAPLGDNVLVELVRGARGDRAALERAVFSLDQQMALMDPVWGGLYQASSGGTWQAPQYQKRSVVQAVNLEAYAFAHRVTGERRFLRHAEAIWSYVERFLTSPEGTFYTSQDADLGAHDSNAPFLSGARYYALSGKQRLAQGVPWIDRHVYAYENGLMIAALVRLHEAEIGAGDALARARRALDQLLVSHVERGEVIRDPNAPGKVRYLVDAAALGRAACRVAERTEQPQYLNAALSIARTLEETLFDAETGAYWAHTPDPDAWGVFAYRTRPLRDNALAARFLACLARLTGNTAQQDAALRTLAAVATPAALEREGRLLGGFLLALDEAGVPLPGAGDEGAGARDSGASLLP